MKSELTKYLVTVAFATLVLLLGFYALVLYEFTLDPLIIGAFIALMTTATNAVLVERAAENAAKRAQTSFDQGLAATPTMTATAGPPATVTAIPPDPLEEEG